MHRIAGNYDHSHAIERNNVLARRRGHRAERCERRGFRSVDLILIENYPTDRLTDFSTPLHAVGLEEYLCA